MSVTLTNRDTNEIIFTATSMDGGGPIYVANLSTIADQYKMRVRHSGVGSAQGASRANLRLERAKRNTTTGLIEKLSVDITVSLDNSSGFAVDDVDDLITWAASYFSSESESGAFILGNARM